MVSSDQVTVVPATPGGRLAATARLVHPFPSLLDGLVVAVVAVVAGGSIGRAAVLGVSMTLMQFAIGALNDVVDAPRDAGRRRGKPLADGLVTPRVALVVVGVCAVAGLLLAATAGLTLALLAVLGLGIGVWYDLAAKGTRLSWLPLAVGIPLLPVYGWLGATGSLPPAFGVLVPAAALGGAGLAIANTIVDIERDGAAGVVSAATALGPRRASLAVLGLQVAVAALAIASAGRMGASGTWLLAGVAAALLPVAGALLGVVVAGRSPAAREIAFEAQAIGLAVLAVAWVNAVSAVTPG